MVNVDIRTRVELRNETARGTGVKGLSGRVALIGAFPSSKQKTYACENFAKVVSHYGVKLNSTAVDWYTGVRAAKRLFMEGIRDYSGASSVTCVNICTMKPNYFDDVTSLYKETYSEEDRLYDVDNKTITGNINVNTGSERYIPTNAEIKKDVTLTFDKLKKALFSIADEDMDLLFIANDLWEILDTPLRERVEYPALLKGAITEEERVARAYEIHSIVVNEKGLPVTIREPVVDGNGDVVTDSNGNIQYTEYLKCPYLTKINEDGTEVYAYKPKLVVPNEESYYSGTKKPRQKQAVDDNGNLLFELDSTGSKILQPITRATEGKGTETTPTPFTGLCDGERVANVYFIRDGLNWSKTPQFYKRTDILDNIVRNTNAEKQPARAYVIPIKKERPVLLNTDLKQWYVDALFGFQKYTKEVNNETVTDIREFIYPSAKIIINEKTGLPVTEKKNGQTVLKCPYKTKDENGTLVYDKDGTTLVELPDYTADGTQKLKYGQKIVWAYFYHDGTYGSSSPEWYDTHYDKLVYNQFSGETKDFGEMTDKNGDKIYGITDSGKYIRNIGDVYDYILDFVDNEFTNHRPINYIGAVKTRAKPEGIDNDYSIQGIGSSLIRLYSERYDYENETDSKKIAKFTPSELNPYADITTWGAVDIANLFTRTSNELETCGLFYQGGIIAGEDADAMELAAHMAGWICSLDLSQDLTYRTIPGLTAVNEEPFLGDYDAGAILNKAGIQVIRPKSRLDKTFYVNNSIMPTGWHTNHVRSVTYLLKRLQFEEGLGINNFVSNTEAYRAMIESTAREVMDDNEIIRDVVVGDVEVINHYHIYIPISIVLSGVVTLVNIGVGMALDETGTIGTYVRTSSGYTYTV